MKVIMDALADVLQPYKELVGKVAAAVTMAQMGSGGFICWDIYKQGNTNNIGIIPFLGVNLFGLALNIVYVMVYFNYAQDKFKIWLQIGLSGALSAALIAYAEYEDPKLKDIIKNKSTAGMPFPMILSGTVVTF
ncbi:Sugar transporter SWEET, partial [Operophtera brumata]